MIALFLALTVALVLLGWSDLAPRPAPRAGGRGAPPKAEQQPAPNPNAAQPVPEAAPIAPQADDSDRVMMERLAALLRDTPEPAPAPEASAPPAPAAALDDLPSVRNFGPGDVLELELDGPAPQARDITFTQSGPDVLVTIWDEPALRIEGATASALTPAILRFRSPRAA